MKNQKTPLRRACVSMAITLALITPAFSQLPLRYPQKRLSTEGPAQADQTVNVAESRTGKHLTAEPQSKSAPLTDLAVTKFRQKYGADARVDWSQKTGLPALVY